jgi:hypothetical protein
MNDLTTTHYNPQSSALSDNANLTMQLAKMMALVAPVTMTSEQQEVWLRGAVDALADIRAHEVEAVSLEVRRSVSRPAQIVPKIAELVAARRAEQSRRDRQVMEAREVMTALPPVKHIMDRDRRKFGPSDWAELNEYLEKQGSVVRYSSDGKKL